MSTIAHELTFCQGPLASPRWIELKLTDSDARWPWAQTLEGKWQQGQSNPDGINLYPGFSAEERKDLVWRWDASQHGGLLEVGKNTPSETKKGKAVAWYFVLWFSFRGCQRLPTGQFRVAGAAYPGGEGTAWYDLAGSSNTFQHGSGTWWLRRYRGT